MPDKEHHFHFGLCCHSIVSLRGREGECGRVNTVVAFSWIRKFLMCTGTS